MKEYVGSCSHCGEPIFCLNGFLNGVHIEGKLNCFECDDKEQKFKN